MLKTWEDVSDLISFPKGARHGTAFKVPARTLSGIASALNN